MFETSQIYEARAYLFQGLKPEEQKYRRRHFKRCQGNRFCEQSLEQEGKKWVVSRCVMTSKNEKEVLLLSPSPLARCKEIPVVSSCYEGNLSDSTSQIPTTAVPEQLNRVRESTINHTPNNVCNIAQESTDAYGAMRRSGGQPRADSVQIRLEGPGTLVEDGTPVVAEGSAVASSSRPAKGQETRRNIFPHHKEKADGDSTSGSNKQKSPQQLERRRERRRRAQQTRRLMKSEKQDREPTPRVFMQWEKSEVQRWLYKQELTLKSAYRAELQKQEIALKSAYRAELQRQEIALKSAHQTELRKQALELMSAHQAQQASFLRVRDKRRTENILSMLSACKELMGRLPYYPNPPNHTVHAARLLLVESCDNMSLALEDLVKEGDVYTLYTPLYERLHCELHL